MAREDDDVIRQLEQASERGVQNSCLTERIAGGVEIGSADVTDEERVPGEDQPRLVGAATKICQREGTVRRRMSGCGERGDDRVPEFDALTVLERLVWERNTAPGREVRRRVGLRHERRETRHVIRLDVRLEDGHDRRADRRGRVDVRIDEVGVGVDNRELRMRRATDEVARARAGVVQERT